HRRANLTPHASRPGDRYPYRLHGWTFYGALEIRSHGGRREAEERHFGAHRGPERSLYAVFVNLCFPCALMTGRMSRQQRHGVRNWEIESRRPGAHSSLPLAGITVTNPEA